MKSTLEAIKGKRIVIISHENADVDSVASLYLLKLFLERSNSVTLAVPGRLDSRAQAYVRELNLPIRNDFQPDFFDVIIIADTQAYNMIGGFEKKVKAFKGMRIVIDHHHKSANVIQADYTFIDSSFPSCVELILNRLGLDFLDEKGALLAMAGIFYDTSFFLAAKNETFELMSALVKLADYRKAINIGRRASDERELMEKIKAVKRVSVERAGPLIVAKTIVDRFEGTCARTLLDIGFPIALVGSKGERAKISARAQNWVVDEYGLDLAELMMLVGSFIQGSGGGHKAAAGASGKSEKLEEGLELAVELIKDRVKKKEPKEEE